MEYQFADRMSRFSTSAVRDILKWTQGKDIISFGGGLPAEDCFPKEAVRSAFERVFAGETCSLQYGLTEGFLPLREQLCSWMEGKGIRASVDEMLLTTGSQQVIDLAARVLLNEGDTVFTENPTYLAALQVFQSVGAQVFGLPRDAEGIDPEALEAAMLRYRPKLLYASPTFANPTGSTWSLERRKLVLELCKKHQVLIFEDDPYGELRFEEGDPLPSLMALEGKVAGSPVLYTTTFSKTVVPALRTGWVIADERIVKQMAKAKQSADLHSSLLDQQALHQLMLHFDWTSHILELRKEYKRRMETMAELIRRDDIWQSANWRQPSGGMFFWMELPEGTDTEALLPLAIEEGVAFVPGAGFYPNERRRNTMRLNFSHSRPERIKAGMERLASAYRRYEESAKSFYLAASKR